MQSPSLSHLHSTTQRTYEVRSTIVARIPVHCPGHSPCHPKFVVGPEVCGATRDWKFVDGHDVNARVRLEDVCLVDEPCALRFVRAPWTCKTGSAARGFRCAGSRLISNKRVLRTVRVGLRVTSIGPWTRSSKRSTGCTWMSDATDLNQAPAASFSNAGGSTLGWVLNAVA